MRGRRSAYFASRRSFHKFAGSFMWLSHEIIKYLFGSPGRAVRSQPACPGVSSRHWFGASSIATFLLPNFKWNLFYRAIEANLLSTWGDSIAVLERITGRQSSSTKVLYGRGNIFHTLSTA